MRSRLATRVVLATALSTAALTVAGTAFASTSEGSAHAARTAHTGVGQFCGTNDLTFSLSEKTQAGGYYLITAKARPGITCYLKGVPPTASFGSSAGTRVSPAEQAVSETVKVTSTTPAYTGISPKSVDTDDGTDSSRLTVAITGFETKPVTLALPESVSVNKPIATNWHDAPSDAVPFPN